jgi:hypothetical protein
MILRASLAAVTATLLLAACTSDMTTAASALNERGASAKTVAPAPSPLTDSISVSPLFIPAGTQATGTIKLAHPAPTGGLVIALSTDLPLTITLPANATAPAGATIVTFPIATHVGFPNSTTTAPVQAFVNGVWIETGANIVTGASATPAPLAIASVVLAPASIVGGNAVLGTVNLNGAAPSGGALVTIQSTNTAVATAPSTVTVPAGSTSATFNIATTPVTAATSANIAGGFGGGFRTSTLSVTPPVTGALAAPSVASPAADSRFAPNTNITFDWSDVPGAASYAIQIDDSNTFTTPLILEQSLSVSQLSTATLPTTTMWWRVRAVAADGMAGAWSSARRFEVKQ